MASNWLGFTEIFYARMIGCVIFFFLKYICFVSRFLTAWTMLIRLMIGWMAIFSRGKISGFFHKSYYKWFQKESYHLYLEILPCWGNVPQKAWWWRKLLKDTLHFSKMFSSFHQKFHNLRLLQKSLPNGKKNGYGVCLKQYQIHHIWIEIWEATHF